MSRAFVWEPGGNLIDLGRAAMAKVIGDSGIRHRPAGDLEIEIVSITYPG